jgi:hypothetical protein
MKTQINMMMQDMAQLKREALGPMGQVQSILRAILPRLSPTVISKGLGTFTCAVRRLTKPPQLLLQASLTEQSGKPAPLMGLRSYT